MFYNNITLKRTELFYVLSMNFLVQKAQRVNDNGIEWSVAYVNYDLRHH